MNHNGFIIAFSVLDQVRLLQPNQGKLDGIGSIFNRNQHGVNSSAITVEIDNSGKPITYSVEFANGVNRTELGEVVPQLECTMSLISKIIY